MSFLLMVYIGLVPLLFALSFIPLFGKSRLTIALISFLVLSALWQWDVAVLYGHSIFHRAMALALFRILRFGTILLIPSLFCVALAASHLVPKGSQPNWWRFVYNKWVFTAIGLWSAFVYAIGWTRAGVVNLRTVPYQGHVLLFPIYGPLVWGFYAHLICFVTLVILAFHVTRRIPDRVTRKFLIQFLVSAVLMYLIGLLNIWPSIFVVASGLSCIIFSTAIFLAYSGFVSERYRSANRSLHEQTEFLHKVIDFNPNYISVIDCDGRFTMVNQAFARLYGLSSHLLIGRTQAEIEGMRKRTHQSDDDQTDEHDRLQPVRSTFTNEAGQMRTVTTVEVPVNFHHATQTLRVATDITDRIEYEERIRHHAYHDALTGLPNRLAFSQWMGEMLCLAAEDMKGIAVLFIDMDRFKNINDTLGHNVGDQVLCEMGKRLSKLINQETGFVARWGGDEFTLALPFECQEELLMKVQDMISVLEQVISIGDIELFMTPSIGISLYREHGQDIDSLLKAADIAMYRAKETGLAFQIYNQQMTETSLRLELEMDLRRAIDGNEFELYYQPKMETASGRIVGMEALIRWIHPRKGLVSPNEFICIAEDTGMILTIGDWVIEQACKQNQTWIDEGLLHVPISVNISPMQLWFGDIVKRIQEVLLNTGLPPDCLELEITEGIAVENEGQAIEKLDALRDLGVRIAVDDFGKGYSSLNSLRLFPADTLKIDKAFIDQLSVSPVDKDVQIIQHIISLAHAIGLRVVAEGVDSPEQLRFLETFKCDEVQGFLFSRPIPADAFRSFVTTYGPQF
ncbi:hypothetical protein AAC03nite_02650 [Alicyclobacillus acidoterrestris]|nr:hypothetical protein AAC03nite_02650 [Alicyclobacillus acidoterrestris]